METWSEIYADFMFQYGWWVFGSLCALVWLEWVAIEFVKMPPGLKKILSIFLRTFIIGVFVLISLKLIIKN